MFRVIDSNLGEVARYHEAVAFVIRSPGILDAPDQVARHVGVGNLGQFGCAHEEVAEFTLESRGTSIDAAYPFRETIARVEALRQAVELR
jgi:hypothetical protein